MNSRRIQAVSGSGGPLVMLRPRRQGDVETPAGEGGIRAMPESRLICDGEVSLETRWITAGRCPPGMIEWLGPFGGQLEQRSDCYLVGPTAADVGVKIRGGSQLDVKVYAGSPGVLGVPERAQGSLQWWRKWSYSLPSGPEHAVPVGWTQVQKVRRIRFFSIGGRPISADDGAGREAGCAVELTEVILGRRPWWTLGFEATGPVGTHWGALEQAAAYVFNRALPKGVRLDWERSTSYSEWLEENRTSARIGGDDRKPVSESRLSGARMTGE